ncbi:cardiomyopathy-associated protein 5 isoform X2 [Tiliqua scincoides]|uniref:cardiomyopathy-associated protein 5 isoform X2 n=1 Tax=Tiliqua scincoides TaxID=71010 RepID=UPI0034631732
MEMVLDFPPAASRTETQESQHYSYKAAEEYSGPLQPTCLMGEAEKTTEQLQFNLAKEDVKTATALTSSQEPECLEESHLRGDLENQTAPLESQHSDLSLSSPEAQREEIHQHSITIAQPESEHPVISEPVKAPLRSKHGKLSQLGGKEASSCSPAEAVDSSEQLPFNSTALTEMVEKEESQPSTLITATPLLEEQPGSDLPDRSEQMEKQDSAPCSPETPTLVSDASLSAVLVQPADVTKVETEQYSPTQAPSEASVSVSRESDVAAERETIQPDSLLCVKSPPEASVPFQEAVKLENQVSPPINTTLYSEDEDRTHPSRDEGQQEGNVHLLGTTQFEWESSAEFEARIHNIQENSSALPQLEETLALHSVDEAEKDMHSDKSIPEPSHPDSLYSICVPEEQERMQSEMGQTVQHLSSAVLQTESDILPLVKEIDGMPVHLPAATQDVLKPACLTETQEDKGLPTGMATLDSGCLGIPSTVAGAELESKHRAKQIIQTITTEPELDYPKVLPSVSESDLETSFPAPSADFQAHMLVTPQSEEEHPVSSEKEREDIEQDSSITPTPEPIIPTTGPEIQESQSSSSDVLTEVPKPSPIILSFLPVQIKDQELPAEPILTSIPPSEQSNLQSPDLKDKAEIEKSQFPFPEMPKTGPQESVSATTFLIGETTDEAFYSPRDTQIVPEEPSVPEDFASEAIKEMNLPSSLSPAGSFSEESISLYAVDGEKQERSHALLTAESKQLAAGKADIHAVHSHPLATAQSEAKNLDVEPYCPVTTQSEQEDLTLLSKEEIMKQETPLHSFSIVESEPIDQELLHDMGKRDDQEKSPLETDISKVQNAPLLSPVQQQVSEHLNLLQSVEQSEMKEIQPSSFSAVHDSSQRATKTETGICQGSLSTTAENDGGVFVLSEFTDEAAKPEIQPLWNEAAQLECQQPDVSAKEKEQIPFPPATAPQDQGHVGLFSSTEPQLSSPEAQNQTSEQPPSASPLHPEKVKKQEVNSLSPSVLISPALGQSNSVLRDHIEETEQQKIQSYPPVVENVILEEPLSIAAFLLSEAKEIQTSLPLTTEEDHLDVQPLFEEAGLLIDSSADLLEVNGTIKKEIQPSLTHFESQQLSSKPQAEVTHLEKREDIPDIPTTPSFIVNQPSYALLSEPINVTYTQNIPSPISSVDSDEIKGKEAAVTAEDLSKKEEIPCLSSAKKTLQESENNLQKEKELNHQEKLREESVSAPDSSNTSELVRSNTSEDYQVVSIYAHPFISSADGEENKHMPERLEYLETVSSLKTKPCHDVGDVIVTHESSVCNVSTDILEGLTEDVHENKANASTEMVVEVRVQRNVETEKEASACHEKNDSALNVTDMDYVEKYTLITDRSFTQTGKEQSVEVAQRLFDVTKENSEEATAPPASSKNTLDSFLLERDLDEDFHDMVKGENTVKEEETSKISKENESIDAVRKNKEDELILADTPLCSTEKDEVAHSPLTPMRDTTLNPDLLEMPPALSFIYQDLYEEVKAELKNDSCRHPSSEETENDGGVFVLSEFTNEAAKPEIQPLWNEAAQLECQQPDVSAKEKEQIPFPPATVPQDQGHVGLFSSTEPQLSSPEAQNQISEQPPSASPLHPEKVKKQEVNSLSPSVSISPALGQSNSVLQDHIEETEQQKIQSYPPVVENVILEEPLSIAAFLLSEAKEIQTSLPLTTEEDHLDIQPLFEEAGLLIDSSADLLEVNGTIKKEIQPPLTHFESQQLSSKPQAEVTHLEKREDIPDMPTTPSFIVNQPSYALLSEPINVTYTQNIPSPISSVDSDEIKGKEAAVTAEDLSKKEEIPCLSSAKKTLQESENNLQKEKELNHQKKLREESVSAPDSSNTSELVHSNTSEDYQVVSIYAHPFVSSADGEENKHMPERLEYLETVSSLKTKPCHDVGGVIVTHESSVCNVSTDILEGLTEDVHENKANASTEMVVEVRVQRNVETEKEASACHEKNDSALNVTDMDYVEKYTLITDRSFTQTGKEQSVEVAQRLFDVTKENSEEATAPPASSKNTLDSFLLERDLDEDFHDMVKGENTVKEEETSKISKENESIDAVRKNKEDELILAETRLCSAEKDEVAHSPLTPMRDTTLNTDLLEMPPALSFLYQDLYEEVKAELKNDSCRHPSSEETENTNVPLHSSDQVTNDGTGIYFEKDIPKDGISNDLEESQKEQFLKDQPINEQALSQTRVSEGVREPNEKEQDVLYSLTEVQAQSQFVSPRDNVEGRKNALLEGPTEIASDVKVTTCQPALAIPFGSRLYGSGASNDEGSQSRGEDDLSAEAGHALPEETSDEESSPILDYAATLYPEEAPVQDETMDATCLTADQPQQSEVTEVLKEDNYAVIKPVAESTELDETVQEIRSPWENEELEDHFSSDFTEQDVRASEYDHPTGSEAEERVDEHFWDLTAPNKESASRQYAAPEVKSDTAFGELDYSLLSHDFDTYPLYSIKEEEYSDIDEDLAELMDYEMVAQDDVFREETSSEVAREDDRKSLDHISNTYKFVNEREADTYAEEEEFELMGLEKLQKNVPQSEVLQKETEQAQFDAYCNQCKCLICADDKLSGDHKEHHVANLDTAATELKGQLGRFLDVLQERSLKIEGFVSEIEALFNSLEENCKGKEQLLEEQNESIINAVIAGHDKKAQSFEDRKNTKMEYLYEQMVNFQEYIDTAKETLETIVKETEEMDDFVFLRSSEDINKRLLSAVENILILEKMPASFSQFEHYADSSANGDQTLQHMPVPQTPKLQQQDPNSATSTSIAVYWTVSEEDVIDFFQVYCMEEHPENKEQSGLVEEYRVTVKESNCTLEDLEPGHCYSVWIMAVNYTGCSFPSNKFTFRTDPLLELKELN